MVREIDLTVSVMEHSRSCGSDSSVVDLTVKNTGLTCLPFILETVFYYLVLQEKAGVCVSSANIKKFMGIATD